MVQIPTRAAVQAVIIERVGLGWRVGVAPIATGLPDGTGEPHLSERDAEAAGLALADRLDLMALRG